MAGLYFIMKKPLPKEEALRWTISLASSPRRTTSAGVGTENLLDMIVEEVRLPGFHRAGPSTPLDENIFDLIVNQLLLTCIITWSRLFVKSFL